MTTMVDSGRDPRAFRRALIFASGLVFLVAFIFCGVTFGVVEVDWAAFTAGSVAEETRLIIQNIRLPRVVAGALVGMNLALAGAIMQGVLKNPLAAPNTLGVTFGAGFAAMVILILFPHQVYYVPLVAFIGAMAAMFAAYSLAWQGGSIKPMRLILAGVALSALFSGGITAMMVFHSDKVQGAIQWMAGGFQGRSWSHVRMIIPYTILGFAGAVWSSRALNILALGDEAATSLGMQVQRTRLALMTIAGILTASAVSVAGLLGFVGLVVPHITRILVGSDYEVLLPTAAVFGAVLVVGADTGARLIMQPAEIPVGVFMSFIGGPFFLYLLRNKGVH